MQPPTSFWQSPGGASLISAGAGVLGGMLKGGDGYNTYRSHARKLQSSLNHINEQFNMRGEQRASDRWRADTEWNSRWHAENMPALQAKGARDAGLHPLFAMGGSVNAAPAFQSGASSGGLPGQAPTGNLKRDALDEISRHYARIAGYRHQADLIEKQNQASALRIAEQNMMNDTSAALGAVQGITFGRAAGSTGHKFDRPIDTLGGKLKYSHQALAELEDIANRYGDEAADLEGIARYVVDAVSAKSRKTQTEMKLIKEFHRGKLVSEDTKNYMARENKKLRNFIKSEVRKKRAAEEKRLKHNRRYDKANQRSRLLRHYGG